MLKMRWLCILLLMLVTTPKDGWAQEKALKVGEKAPAFSATDQFGKDISLQHLLQESQVVLVFYRGHWCPYCNRQMKALQDSLALIKQKGATLVAVTPEKQESIQKTMDKTGAGFPILHDGDLSIMKAYRVAFPVPEDILYRFKNAGIDISATNGDAGNTLPVPAVYIISREGKITYEFFDPNYRRRASVKEILDHL